MYKLKSVEIDGFWNRKIASTTFNEDVNIIIGRNGTGKTTFMNILHSILTVDSESFLENEFTKVELTLYHGAKTKKIKVEKKSPSLGSSFIEVCYTISRKKYFLEFSIIEERKLSLYQRRKMSEQTEELKQILSNIVNLSSLSVYRLRNSDDLEVRYKQTKKMVSPVDYRLEQLESQFSRYQFELSQLANDISKNLQQDVLLSLLYSKENDQNSLPIFGKEFNKNEEHTNLKKAFRRLGMRDRQFSKRIQNHIESISNAVNDFNNKKLEKVDFSALMAYSKTQEIVNLALKSEEKIAEIFEPIETLSKILHDFIPEKQFDFAGSSIYIENENGDKVNINKLSSGEKQLMILLIETLLQKNKSYIYLTDEPELSLHISWQREILSAIRKLNPNSQIIAATHSPEVAAKFKDSIINMSGIVYE